MYKIITDRPMPEHRGRGAVTKYPFADMEVGHCFVVNDGPKRAAVYGAVARWKRKHPEQSFIILDEGRKGITIWRET